MGENDLPGSWIYERKGVGRTIQDTEEKEKSIVEITGSLIE